MANQMGLEGSVPSFSASFWRVIGAEEGGARSFEGGDMMDAVCVALNEMDDERVSTSSGKEGDGTFSTPAPTAAFFNPSAEFPCPC